MSKDNAAPKVESTALQRTIPPVDAEALIRSAIEQKADVETLERMFALTKDLRAVQAREAFNRAMAEFQATCPPVVRGSEATIRTSSGGSYSYTYAKLSEVMTTIQPVMGPLGLSVSFRVRHEPDRVIASARISHDLGHFEESGEVAMPVQKEAATGAGAMGANPMQRVGIASTYAKRYALLAVLGIAPIDEDDQDGEPAEQKVPPPRRSGEARPKAAQPAAAPAPIWTGKILNVKKRTGKKGDGSDWTLFIAQTSDAQEFVTFDVSIGAFLTEAGSSQVRITYEANSEGKSPMIISAMPAEPGADD